jgi:hypothetical protein
MKNINEDLIKRSLLYMNYDSKKTLSENVEGVLLNEAKTDKSYFLAVLTHGPGDTSKQLNSQEILVGSEISKDGDFVDVKSGSINYRFDCKSKIFTSENIGVTNIFDHYNDTTWVSSSGKVKAGSEMENVLLTEYCLSKTDDEIADDTSWFWNFSFQNFWYKGLDSSGYWVELYNELNASGYQFKLLNKDKKATTDIKTATQMWWKNFIISRNLDKYPFITVGSPAIAYANLQKKYEGEKNLTNVILKMGKGFVGTDLMSLKNFLDTDWKAVPKKDEKVIDYTQEKKKTTIKSSWNEGCKGTYSMSCKTPEVGQAQQCLKDANLYPYRVDNKFGKLTRDAVKSKLGKSSFTDADLQTICKTKEGSGSSGDDLSDFNQDYNQEKGSDREKEDTTWTGDLY